MDDTTVIDYETWQNATQGRAVIIKLDGRGGIRHDIVGPGKTFHVTPQERRMNQERAASEEQDLFLNGTLQPIRLLEGDVEYDAKLTENPNHVTEDEVRSLFKAHFKTFEKRVAEITNPSALEKLMEVAREDDVNATVKQVELIQRRLAEVSPSLVGAEMHPEAVGGSTGGPPSGIKAVTPR